MRTREVTSSDYFRRLALGRTGGIDLTPDETQAGGCHVEILGDRPVVVGPKTDFKALRIEFTKRQAAILGL